MFTPGGSVEIAITSMTQWTGSLFLTLLMIMIIILVISLALSIPLEWTAIFIMPLLLLLMSYDAAFYQVGAAFLLYLAFIMAIHFLRR